MDVCDTFNRFETEVPRRALACPALFYAVLALSARHENTIAGRTAQCEEADNYYFRCLDLMIPSLDPGDPIHEDIFITIIVLRLYEERAGEFILSRSSARSQST